MPSRRLLSLAATLLAGASLFSGAGCTQIPDSDLGIEVIQFRDVRVPREMTIVSSKAESHSQAVGQAYRYGDFEYVGSMGEADVVAYLESAMPQHGWAKSSDEQVGNARKVSFTRGIYDTTYTIERGDRQTKMRVELRTSPTRSKN